MNKILTVRNRIILSNVLNTTSIIVPIQTAYYLILFKNNLSIPSLLTTIMLIAIFIFEIPSGYLSDKIGNKFVSSAGFIFQIISMIILSTCDSIWMFMCSGFLLGLSAAFLSGAKITYFMSICKKENIDFNKLYVSQKKISKLFSAVLMIFSGYLFSINIRLPFTFNSFMFIIVYLIFISLPKEDIIVQKKEEIYNFKKSTKKVFNAIRNNKYFLFLLIFYTILSRILIINFGLYNRFFEINKINVSKNGYIFATFMIINLIGIKIYEKIKTKNKESLIFVLFLPISFLLIMKTNLWCLFIAIFFQEAIFAYLSIEFELIFYDSIPSEDISSYYQSVISFIDNALQILISAIFTFIIYRIELKTYFIFSLISFVLIITLYYLRRVDTNVR